MINLPATVQVPLREDADGVIRVGKTRVTLLTIVGRYRADDTPQEIHEGFPTVSLTDIYAVITYYLENSDEIDAYIQQVDAEAEAQRKAEEEARLAEAEAKRKADEAAAAKQEAEAALQKAENQRLEMEEIDIVNFTQIISALTLLSKTNGTCISFLIREYRSDSCYRINPHSRSFFMRAFPEKGSLRMP